MNLFERSKERHFAVARERMREGKAAVDWLEGASPKLIPPEDRLAIGGGTI